MRKTIKIIALLLVVATVFAVPVHGTDMEDRASAYFMTSTASIDKVSSLRIEAGFIVGAYGIMDELGASSIKIQRSLDGNNWTTMKTFSKEDYSQLICENTASHGASVTYIGSAGYYYRAKITLYAKQGAGIGEAIHYTNKIQL